jgi:hypothetical protein
MHNKHINNSILVGPTDSDNTEEEIFGQVEVWKEA